MNPPSPSFLVHGAAQAPPPLRPLRAGPVTLDYQDGDLRAVRLAGHEVIRRIYGAVRDRNWGTVPAQISELKFEVSDRAFRIGYLSEHRSGDLSFVWRAELTGDADGTLHFDFDGQANSTFLRNRIGLCVLHPVPTCAGARVRARLTDGSVRELTFPQVIAAEQPVRGFDTLAGLDHEILPGLWAEVRFSGETFETEDQRNWIDASFKTYGTPLRLPFPVEIQAGDRVRQRVEVRFRDDRCVLDRKTPSIAAPFETELSNASSVVQVSLPDKGWVPLPELGLECSSTQSPENFPNRKLLGALPISHLRADAMLASDDWGHRLLCATLEAQTLNLPLELAVHVTQTDNGSLNDLRSWFQSSDSVVMKRRLKRILAFSTGQKTTTSEALALTREHLGDLGVPIGAGTNGDLYRLNLQRPPADADFVAWSMNPQVHARDTRSLMETPGAAAAQIASVKTYFPGKPLVVSPITLRPRFHPGVSLADGNTAVTTELPAAVDPRQMSLAGAAWTVAMLAALAPSGVESLTFYETSGWRGVMETARGSTLPDQFPSLPGDVFPVWHVFAALSGFRSVAAGQVSHPERIAVLGLSEKSGRFRMILANLTPESVEVCLDLPGAAVRLLDEQSVAGAMHEPESWWKQEPRMVSTLRLTAHAIAFIDLA
ncbi:MAG: hypothetical protein RIS76_2808 [Verrucomicrobiota bacterium]